MLRLYVEAGMSTGFFYERENYVNTCIQRLLRLFYVIDGQVIVKTVKAA